MKTFKSLAVLLIIFFSSCTIVQEYHFNKDFSGSTKLSIDMGSFMEMMAGMDSSGTQSKDMKDSMDFVFKESAGKLDSLGMKNIKYGWVDSSNILYMSYDFNNIESLNKAQNTSNSQNNAFSNTIGSDAHVYFTRKRKSLTYTGPKSDKDISNNKDMQSMNDYYKYSLIFSFDRKVKSIDNPNVTISADNKKVELKGNMFEIIRPDYNSDITFKLK